MAIDIKVIPTLHGDEAMRFIKIRHTCYLLLKFVSPDFRRKK